MILIFAIDNENNSSQNASKNKIFNLKCKKLKLTCG